MTYEVECEWSQGSLYRSVTVEHVCKAKITLWDRKSKINLVPNFILQLLIIGRTQGSHGGCLKASQRKFPHWSKKFVLAPTTSQHCHTRETRVSVQHLEGTLKSNLLLRIKLFTKQHGNRRVISSYLVTAFAAELNCSPKHSQFSFSHPILINDS